MSRSVGGSLPQPTSSGPFDHAAPVQARVGTSRLGHVGSKSTVGFIAAARVRLLEQRTFRIHQLKQLDASVPLATIDVARAEIHNTLRAAARSVLGDISAALRRIEDGSYGRCTRCGDAISEDRLNGLPMAALCGLCLRTQALCSYDEPGKPSAAETSRTL